MFEQAFKNIDDAIWKDAGCDSELDYAEQSSWILFLKWLDDFEKDEETKAKLDNKKLKPIFKSEYRWSSWAVVKDEKGNIDGFVHSHRQSKDWQELKKNDELFFTLNGETIRFEEDEPYIPVFINEAAYVEKNIAMSFTKRELWDFKKVWKQSLIDLVHQK